MPCATNLAYCALLLGHDQSHVCIQGSSSPINVVQDLFSALRDVGKILFSRTEPHNVKTECDPSCQALKDLRQQLENSIQRVRVGNDFFHVKMEEFGDAWGEAK